MAYTAPLLNKPAEGWKHDLPGPNHPPTRTPNTRLLPDPPNHVDDIYLELARATHRMRGLGVWCSVFIIALVAVCAFFLAMIAITSPSLIPLGMSAVGLASIGICIWAAIYIYGEWIPKPLAMNPSVSIAYVAKSMSITSSMTAPSPSAAPPGGCAR